jgi:MFS family permease
MGFLFLPPLNLIAHYFRRRRFLAMGITVTGSCCGGIVFPIMLNKLLENPNIGFAWAVRACALLILVCLTIAFFLMKTRLPNRKEKEALGLKTEKPDVMGNLTDPAFILTSLGYVISWEETLGRLT